MEGQVGVAPSDADFLPLVSAPRCCTAKPRRCNGWKGLKANAQIFDDDEGVTAAVNRGGVLTGIINNYYWDRLHAETGDKSTRSAIYHFGKATSAGPSTCPAPRC